MCLDAHQVASLASIGGYPTAGANVGGEVLVVSLNLSDLVLHACALCKIRLAEFLIVTELLAATAYLLFAHNPLN